MWMSRHPPRPWERGTTSCTRHGSVLCGQVPGRTPPGGQIQREDVRQCHPIGWSPSNSTRRRQHPSHPRSSLMMQQNSRVNSVAGYRQDRLLEGMTERISDGRGWDIDPVAKEGGQRREDDERKLRHVAFRVLAYRHTLACGCNPLTTPRRKCKACS